MPGSSDFPPLFSVAIKDEAAAARLGAGENAPSHEWSWKVEAAGSDPGM